MMEKDIMPSKKEILKTVAKVFGILLLGIFLALNPNNPEYPSPEVRIPLIEQKAILLGLLILLITGFVKISLKNPTGWSLIAIFFYLTAYRHIGITAWMHFIIAAWAFWVAISWRYNITLFQNKTELDDPNQ
jgi:hypothetical protein